MTEWRKEKDYFIGLIKVNEMKSGKKEKELDVS